MAEDVERFIGSSPESFAQAVRQAVEANPRATNYRRLEVVREWVDEGGVVGGLQYHVELAVGAEAEES
jgi:flavin-binding protein dodecin